MYTSELKHTGILNLRNLPACNYMHAVAYCKVKSKSYMQLVTAQQVQYIDQKGHNFGLPEFMARLICSLLTKF